MGLAPTDGNAYTIIATVELPYSKLYGRRDRFAREFPARESAGPQKALKVVPERLKLLHHPCYPLLTEPSLSY